MYKHPEDTLDLAAKLYGLDNCERKYALGQEANSNVSVCYALVLDQIGGDFWYTCGEELLAQQLGELENPQIFVSLFNHHSSSNPYPEWMGATHGSEFDLFLQRPFANRTHAQGQFTDGEIKIYEHYSKMIDFIIGRSSALKDGFNWPPYTAGGNFPYWYLAGDNDEISLKYGGIKPDKCRFWFEVTEE